MSDYRLQLRYTYSSDGGTTWARPQQISDQPVNFSLGVSFNSVLRQPPRVASANQYALPGWADTRFANDLTQTQDNFAARVEFSSLPPEKSTVLPIVAAVFAGLLVAGIVLVALPRLRWRT